ncbi:response regulator, partial [candidate division CSSED10-310 bacterium]
MDSVGIRVVFFSIHLNRRAGIISELSEKYSILIIDDEESILQALQGVFSDEGFIVLTAISGEEGLALLQSEPVDLVFLDIWLPGMD